MTREQKGDILVHAKFHRPPLSRDHLHRDALLDKLDRGRLLPLTLVSAPAGYGKSTLISCWLEGGNTPYCWCSLDDRDNDLRIFLLYLVSSIQSLSTDNCVQTMAMLKGAHLPPASTLLHILSNEIGLIAQPFILVLDDYHLIRDRAIHRFLSDLLSHPPAGMHLVVISRRDPPLPLVSWRAKGHVNEMRTQDLRFSLAESEQFLCRLTGLKIDKSVVSILEKKTEGWVTGLRLAALSLMHRDDLQSMLAELPAENRYVIDYVLQEVLSQYPLEIQDCILKISILSRFCAPLCEAVCLAVASADTTAPASRDFLEKLGDINLFTIALDDDGTWFRYHHLIKSILRRLLKKRFTPEQITTLYKLASKWFADHGYHEEALSHSLEIDDYTTAAEVVAQHRLDLIDGEQWYHLDHWLKKFPTEVIHSNSDLMLSQAWVYQRQARYSKLFELLSSHEQTAPCPDLRNSADAAIRGEVATLQSFHYYSTGQPLRAEQAARLALELLPASHQSIKGFAQLVLVVTLQMLGAREKSTQLVFDLLKEEHNSSPVNKTMLLASLCFSSWVEADLHSLKPAAEQLLKHGTAHSLPESMAISSYFLGIQHYQRNELDQAERLLRQVTESEIAGQLVVPSIITYCQSMFALALTCQAKDRSLEATQIVDTLVGYMLETDNFDLLSLCQTFQAELQLRQGDSEKAFKWAQKQIPKPYIPAYRFYSPHLALPKISIAKASADSLKEAERLLSQLTDYFNKIYSFNVLISIHALQALLKSIQGEVEEVREKLTLAIDLARPGHLLRPFLDLGTAMHNLLDQHARVVPEDKFVEEILQAFESAPPGVRRQSAAIAEIELSESATRPRVDPLTNREIEVLKLLATGGSNNELANSLHISPETVKRHLSTIYRKLAVKSRHQAVIKGESLGIL